MSKKDNKGCGCLGAFLVVFFVVPVVLAGIGAVVDYFEQKPPPSTSMRTSWTCSSQNSCRTLPQGFANSVIVRLLRFFLRCSANKMPS